MCSCSGAADSAATATTASAADANPGAIRIRLSRVQVCKLCLSTPLRSPLPRLITSSSHAALREVPSYLELIQQLQHDGVCIDVLAVDGFGALHPRGAGAATQLGVQARLPCVGVGKSLSGACSLREPEVVAMMDERVALQLDISAYCSASAAADSAGSTRCCVSCVAVRKTLASRRPVYVTVSPNPQIPIPLTI